MSINTIALPAGLTVESITAIATKAALEAIAAVAAPVEAPVEAPAQKAVSEKPASKPASKKAGKGKKARKAEAPDYSNRELAAALRAIEVVPSGSAWSAFKAGERDPKTLADLNAADGLTFRKAGEPKAAKSPKASAKASTKAAESTEPTKAERKTAKRRSKAAKKAYATRVANGSVVRVNGKFVKAGTPVTAEKAAPVADEAEATRSGGKKALFWADLADAGLTEAQIEAAWAVRA